MNHRKERLLEQLAQDNRELEEAKSIRPHDFFKPMPGGQAKFWGDPRKEKWIFGGNQSGKTTTLVNYIIRACKAKPGSRWYVGSTSMDRSRTVVQHKFHEFINKEDIARNCSYRSDKGFPNDTFRFTNGSIILFLSYEMDTDKWAGDTVDGVGFDEEPTWDKFVESQKRIIALDGELVGAMTALKSFTRLVNRVYMDSNPKIGLFIVPLHENNTRYGGVYSDKRVEEIVEETPEDERASRIYGKPTLKSGLVYSEWHDEYPWVISREKEFAIPHHFPRYMAIDPHGSTPQACIWIAVDPSDGQHYAYRELWQRMLIPELAAYLRQVNTPYDVEETIIDNHYSTQRNSETGKNIKELLLEHGDIYAVGGCDDVIARIDMLKMWEKVNKATGKPRLQIFESCTQTRWEKARYEWDSPISERVAERRDDPQKPKSKNGHLMNTLEYLAAHGGSAGLPIVDVHLPDDILRRVRERQKSMEYDCSEEEEHDFSSYSSYLM